jgi:tetratricopeptide (TPR) repeat protein
MASPVDRSIAGTTDWAQYEIVLDIPEEAVTICLGFLLHGSGTVWADDLDLEFLDRGQQEEDKPSSSRASRSVTIPSLTAPGSRLSPTGGERDPNGGGAGLADHGIFLGRGSEQREFERLLDELVRTPRRSQKAWAHVVIVHGIGGIGKTRLAARFRKIADADTYLDRYEVVSVDWADLGPPDPGSGAGPNLSVEAVLDILEQECSRSGRLARYFEEYRQLRVRIASIRSGVDSMDDRAAGAPAESMGRSVRALGSAIQAGEALGVPPGIGEATQVAGLAVDAGTALWRIGKSWRRDRLSPGDYELLVRPVDALVSAFASGLAKAASRRPIVLLTDTCELVAPVGSRLRILMRQSGPRVAWLLFGRFEADPSGWPTAPELHGDPVPSGRASELDAYRAEVPADRLRTFKLHAFDAGLLREYFSVAAPRRPVSDAELSRLHAATAGVPLAVRLAASLWEQGMPIEMITDPVPVSANHRMLVETMTGRFLLHLSREDKEKIQELALVLYPDDPDLVAVMWATDRVIDAFESLAQRYDVILTGQFRLHDTIHAFLLRYLLNPYRRAEVRPVNQRAAAFLEQRLQARQRTLPTLERRMANERWVSDMLALTWHRFWIDNQNGWATLLAAFPAAIAYNPAAGRALLDLAGNLVPSTMRDEQRRLRLLRDTVGPMTTLFEQVGAECLSELADRAHRAPVDPDTGCGNERDAILEWLHGQRALHHNDLPEALEHLTAAAALSPEQADRLRQWISRSIVALSRRLLSESPAEGPDPQHAQGAEMARLAVDLEPGNPNAWRHWGIVLDQLGRYDEAIAALDAAIELDPDDADLHVDRGEILRAAGRYDDALEAANRAIRLNPGDTRAVASRGETHRQVGQYEDALNALNNALDNGYQEPWVFVSRGLAHHAQGDHEEAFADFGNAIELDGEFSLAFHARGLAYHNLGQYEEARTDLDRAVVLDPGNARTARDRNVIRDAARRASLLREWISLASDSAASSAFLAEHVQDLTDSITINQIATDCGRNPADLKLWKHLGLLLLGDEAVDGYAAGQPGNPSPAQRAAALMTDGDLDGALAWSCLARAAEPGTGALIMSRVQLQRGNPDAADEALATATDEIEQERLAEILGAHDGLLAAQMDRADTHLRRGVIFDRLGRDEEALQAFDMVAELEPGNAAAQYNRGILLDRLNRPEEALAAYDLTSRLEPDWEQVHSNRADLLSRLDRPEEALAALDRAIELEPNDPWLHVERATALERARRPGDALNAYDNAVSLDPDNPSLHFNKGQLLFGLSRHHDAQAELEEVTRLRPSDILGAAVLLAAIAWPDDQDRAREHLRAALASPGELLTPYIRAYYRAFALAGLGDTAQAIAELQAAQPGRTSGEMDLDDADIVLLDRFSHPALPGIDLIRACLQQDPTSRDQPGA